MAKKVTRPPGRGSDQFVIRFPDGMRDRIAKLAIENGRSMNAELIDRLEKSMGGAEEKKTLESQMDRLGERIEAIAETLKAKGIIKP